MSVIKRIASMNEGQVRKNAEARWQAFLKAWEGAKLPGGTHATTVGDSTATETAPEPKSTSPRTKRS